MDQPTAVVTGSSTGIGYAIARCLVLANYTVYGSVRKPEDAERLSRELGESFQPQFNNGGGSYAVEIGRPAVAKKMLDPLPVRTLIVVFLYGFLRALEGVNVTEAQ